MSDLRLERLNAILSPPLSETQTAGEKTQRESFSEILQGEIEDSEGIKFSKHAQERLESRGITLGPEDMQKLEGAVDLASRKGVRESLVMMDSLAFIISVPGRTVVTALPAGGPESHVFTNIDGAVIL